MMVLVGQAMGRLQESLRGAGRRPVGQTKTPPEPWNYPERMGKTQTVPRTPGFSPAEFTRSGSVEEGREAFVASQCILCHHIGAHPGGSAGPNLTGIGSRFGGRDLLEQILDPSKVIDEKYRGTRVTLKDGTIYGGIVESETEEELELGIGTSVDDAITIEKSSIVRREPSNESPMPSGLLNILNKEQIFNLLSYLQASP